jgi:hypothetical protein
MLIRQSLETILTFASETVPMTGVSRDWIMDWRWLSTPDDDDTALPSERSLIDCAPWAKPKKPRHA